MFSALGLARRRRVVVVILSAAMYLMYYVNENGDKVYTLKVSVLFSLMHMSFSSSSSSFVIAASSHAFGFPIAVRR